MKLKKFIYITTIIISTFFIKSNLFSLSASMQSLYDYNLSLDMLRDLNIIVNNFGIEKDNNNYNYKEIKKIFKEASERHYAQEFLKPLSFGEEIKPDNNFQSSLDLFRILKVEIIKSYDMIAKDYSLRTRSILDSTSKDINEIIITYSKKSPLSQYFYLPINPLYEPKPYKTEEFHLFYEKSKLETYLKKGYKVYHESLNIFKDGDFIYIKSKKKKSNSELNFLIEKYLKAIKLFRLAKQYGIEIHKILKTNQLPIIQQKYDVSYNTILRYQIFDDRIPEEYKIDAIDNRKLDFTIEKERLSKRSKSLLLKPQ